MNKNERNFWLDWTMFIVFMITIVSGFLLWLAIPNGKPLVTTGIDRNIWLMIHIVSGFLGLLGVVIHIIWHWDWLKALRGRSPGTLTRPVRANRVIDRLIWFTFISCNVFGILAWLLSASLPAGAIRIFSRLHFASSMAWLVFMVAHLVLHQKWIVAVTRRYSLSGGRTGSIVGLIES
jgi:hypothetical protein